MQDGFSFGNADLYCQDSDGEWVKLGSASGSMENLPASRLNDKLEGATWPDVVIEDALDADLIG